MWKRYITPASLDDALHILAEKRDHARIIAGGTDVIIELELNKYPDHHTLIDITRIPGLDAITQDDDGQIVLGPLVTQNHVVGSNLVQQQGFPLAQAAWSEAAPQIRNRATVAGNVITASPANDTIPALMVLGAVIELRSVDGVRQVPISDFYTGFRETVMAPHEILTAIRFPPMADNEHGVFLKLGLRRAQAISVVNIAVILSLQGKTIQEARIAYGSVAPTVIGAAHLEEALTGKVLTEAVINDVAKQARDVGQPIDDVRGPAHYRRIMTERLLRQALRTLQQGREREGYPQQPVMLWGQNEARVTQALEASTEHEADTPIETTINGERLAIEGGAGKTLLRMLREDAGLIGSKEGCAEGECGACTVFLDGAAVMACMVPAPRAHHAEIVTIEGLRADNNLHPVQQGFVQAGAVQCGYCTPGFVMAGAKLLEERETPTEWEIKQSITGNLCRCTGYYKIIEAIDTAANSKESHHGA